MFNLKITGDNKNEEPIKENKGEELIKENYQDKPGNIDEGSDPENNGDESSDKEDYQYIEKQYEMIDGKYLCKIDNCNKILKTKALFDNHVAAIHDIIKKLYMCKICRFKCVTNKQLYKHTQLHNADSVKCSAKDCLMLFSKNAKASLTQHIKKDHVDILPFGCSLCDNSYKEREGLKNHIEIDHKSYNDWKYACKTCGCKFPVKKYQIRHEKLHNDPHALKCKFEGCLKLCMTQRDLNKHLRDNHNQDTKYKCNIGECTKDFIFESQLKEHQASLHKVGDIKYKCNFEGCTKQYAKKSRLDRHQASKHGVEGVYKWKYCEYENCDRKFMNNQVLTEHESIDHGINQFVYNCGMDNCEDSFTRYSTLRQHWHNKHGINPKDKVFTCDECGSSFETKSKLNQHIKTTHPIELIECQIDNCGIMFKTKSSFKSHQETYHNPNAKRFECDMCTLDFVNPSNLVAHKASIHDIGKFTCDLCLSACGNKIQWYCKITNAIYMVCRKCYHKNTGFKTRIEKEVVDFLKENFQFPICKQDQRINGEICSKYRPDVMYTCCSENMIIYVEIDERQHKFSASYKCEEKRMSEIYDETPGSFVVFIRFNPDDYKLPFSKMCKGKLKKQERFELLLESVNFVIQNKKTLMNESMMYVLYVCYDRDNEIITQNISKMLIYDTGDLTDGIKII